MGVLIVLALVAWPIYRSLSNRAARKASAISRRPDPIGEAMMLRWIGGNGPDPRAVMFCDGVPVEVNSTPELSSLA